MGHPALPLALLVTAVEGVPHSSLHTVQGLCLADPSQSSRDTAEGPGTSLKSQLRPASGREKMQQGLRHSWEEHDGSEVNSRGVGKLLAG